MPNNLRRRAWTRIWLGLIVVILLVAVVPVSLGPARASTSPDFTISDDKTALSIPVASEQQSTVTVTSINGFSGSVTEVATPSSSSFSCWFETLTNSAMFSLSTGGSNHQYPTCGAGRPAGSYTLAITATSGSITHSVILAVNVTDFSITGPSTMSLNAGSLKNAMITVTSLYGLTGTIPLGITSPQGFSAYCPSSVTLVASASSTIACPLASPTAGTFDVTVTGSFFCGDCYRNGVDTGSFTASVDVLGPSVPGYAISIGGSLTVTTGYPSSTAVKLTSLNGFSGQVSVSTMAPSGLTASVSPTSVDLVSGSATVSLSIASADCGLGNSSVLFNGTSGSESFFASVLLSVTPQNPWQGYGYYTACADPISLSVTPGSSATSTITVARQNPGGYVTGLVNLTAFTSPSSSSINCQVTPSNLTFNSTTASLSSTLNCTSSTPGNYAVYVRALWWPPFQCNSPSCTCVCDPSSTTRVDFLIGSPTLVSVVEGTDSNLYSSVSQSDGSWSSWQSLSGSSPSPPITCRFGQDSLALVVRGEDGGIYVKTYSSGIWSASWNKNPDGVTIDQPACAVLGNSLYVVVRGATRELYATTLDLTTGAWAEAWTDLTGSSPSVPSFTATPGLDRLDLLVRGFDNQLYHKSLLSGVWSQSWDTAGGVITDAPVAVSDGSILQVVVVGATSDLWYNSLPFSSNTWIGWVSLDGSTPSTPTLAFTPGLNRGDLIVRGTDNGIYHKTLINGVWSSTWESLNGLTSHSPAIATDYSALRVEVVAMDGSLVANSLTFNISGWSGWAEMTGASNLTPSIG